MLTSDYASLLGMMSTLGLDSVAAAAARERGERTHIPFEVLYAGNVANWDEVTRTLPAFAACEAQINGGLLAAFSFLLEKSAADGAVTMFW